MDEVDFLRLSKEPCTYYDEMTVHRALMKNINGFMDLIERFYFAWQKNNKIVNQPKKQVFTTNGLRGDFRVMPCVIDKFEGEVIKTVKVIGTNEEEKYVKDKNAVGKALLIDSSDNYVKGIFDVCALSAFRTAAISALAFKHAIDPANQKVGVIGAGRIGFYTAVILSRWLGINEFNVHDINNERLQQFKGIIDKEITTRNINFSEICKYCTAVFLTTTSTSPLLKENTARNIQFISSVGADTEELSELHESLLKNREVISESRQNISFGDMGRWHKAGLLNARQVIELREIINRPNNQKQPVLFISTGTAIQDALICHFLFELFNRENERILATRSKTILFYPEHPRENLYNYSIIKLCHILGYKTSVRPNDNYDLIMRWEDNTYGKIDEKLEELAKTNEVINLNCIDISKRHVDKVFDDVFGYASLIDPLIFKGECVEKSNLNGKHDGRVVLCPLARIKEDRVYQKLIDNRCNDEFVVDIRVPVFKKIIPFVYLKYKPVNDRFSLSVKGKVEELGNILSPEEVGKILQFCEKIGLDCGELDILRDQVDNRIYVMDVNNSPTLHFAGFTEQQKMESLKRMCRAFVEAFVFTA